ncbi:MAG TPA: hypothetical protein VLM40_07070 [Gemmata sp.]|nr:hypothetical protein [Gemmata sp.]
MPIVLSLSGQLEVGERKLSRQEARDWLARAALWFEGVGDVVLDTRLMRDADDRPVLLVDLHPVSTPVEVRLAANGRLRVTAATTPAGPGYHQHLCKLLRQLATEFGFAWIADDCTDPTRYFASRDRGRLEQHFLNWLGAACTGAPRALGLPAGHDYCHPGEVLTPLGPRSKEWTQIVAREPAQGIDFFPWWSSALNPSFYRNRALTRLWCEYPWRPPLTEAEGEMADQIANDLATAFKLDPDVELPWPEWLELLAAIQADADGEHFCVTPTDPILSIELWKRTGPVPCGPEAPRIGYRRFPVRVSLDGGWSIEIPGSFAEEWDEQRNWTAWDRTRTVWFRRMGFTKPDGSTPTAEEALEMGLPTLPEGERIAEFHLEGARGIAMFGATEEEGRTLWRLSGIASTDGFLAVCNIYCESESDRGWAVSIWNSLRQSNGH